MTPNIKAFLDMIAWSEIGADLLKISDNGYNVCVGSTPQRPILFTDYSQHPRIHNEAANSDAAGRYQFMGRYWLGYKAALNLPDFWHDSQDKWAVQLLKECHAIDDIEAGHIESAINKCASRWASLPGNCYGQHINKMADLMSAYLVAGGTVAAS